MCGFSCNDGAFSAENRVKTLLGHAAVSRAGHDSGKIYLVTGVEHPCEKGEMLLLSDGKARRFLSPKRKKSIHVTVLKQRDDAAWEALTAGKPLDDSVIVHAVNGFRSLAKPHQGS